MSRFLLILAALFGLSLAGFAQEQEKEWARPLQPEIRSYSKDFEYTFQTGVKYPIIHETDDAYYIHLVEENDLLFCLPKDLAASINAIRVKEDMRFNAIQVLRSTRAYIILFPDTTYPIEAKDGDIWTVKYQLGKSILSISLSSDIFTLEGPPPMQLPPLEDSLDAICVINFADGSAGSGFLLQMEGQLYCLTNQHVVANPNRRSIQLVDGTELETGKLEFAHDRDLARIKIEKPYPAFTKIRAPILDEPLSVLGNSLGAGRVTILKGEVTGVSLEEIETNAQFVSGNSGSPILGANDEVLGVATLIETFPEHDSLAKGTSFEKGRRVGIRIDSAIEWEEVDLVEFVSRNRLIIQANTFIDELPHLYARVLTANANNFVPVDDFTDPILVQWLNYRNQQTREINQKFTQNRDKGLELMGQRFLYTEAYSRLELGYTDELLETARNQWSSMRQRIQTKKRMLENSSPHPRTKHLLEQIDQMVLRLDQADAVISIIDKHLRPRGSLE